LEIELSESRGKRAKGLAHYRIGVFHDNNGREAKAIPHYRRALALGLPPIIRAEALAWLASSLYKTGRCSEALVKLRMSSKLARDAQLQRFLRGLERRIFQAEILTRKAAPAKAPP
jgi:tetratricopeptide (TPR) repeat protein